jgi:hypothetical protein
MFRTDIKLSVYPTFRSTRPSERTLAQVLEQIRTGDGAQVEEARAAGKESAKYRENKEARPFVCFNTRFRGEKTQGTGEMTGLCYIDIDSKENPGFDAETGKNVIIELPYVVAVWRSFGGDGLGILCAIPENTTHTEFSDVYDEISCEISELFPDGVQTDVACRNHNRGNFLSWDTNIFTANADKVVRFQPIKIAEQQPETHGTITKYNTDSATIKEATQLLEASGWRTVRGKYWTRPGKARGVSAIFNDFGQFAGKLKVYTSEGGSLPEGMHSRFDVLMHLAHGGNRDAAISDIRGRGFAEKTNTPTRASAPARPQQPAQPAQPTFAPVAATDPIAELVNEICEKIDLGETPKIKDFPYWAFPVAVQELAADYAAKFNGKLEYILPAMLSVAGAATRKKVNLNVANGWIEYPIFWTVAAGPAGDGKSHPVQRIIRPLLEHQNKLDAAHAADKERYEHEKAEYESLNKSERQASDANGRAPVEPKALTLFATDATIEGILSEMGKSNGFLFMHSDEFMGFVDSLNSYKGGKGSDLQTVLKMWSRSDIHKVLATKAKTSVVNPFFPIAGCAVLADLSKYMGQKGMTNGFFERVLYCIPKHSEYKERDFSEVGADPLDTWDARITSYISSCESMPEAITLRYGADVAAKKQQTEKKLVARKTRYHEEGDNKRIELEAKLDTYTHRVAVALWAMNDIFYGPLGENVPTTIYDCALDIIDYFRSTAHHVIGLTEKTDMPHENSPEELAKLRKKIAKQAYFLVPEEHKTNWTRIVVDVVNKTIGEANKVNASTVRNWKSRDGWDK